jgi:hypothetical protein
MNQLIALAVLGFFVLGFSLLEAHSIKRRRRLYRPGEPFSYIREILRGEETPGAYQERRERELSVSASKNSHPSRKDHDEALYRRCRC